MRPLSALLVAAALATGSARADVITVFAAASLKEALDANATAFEVASGHKVVVSYAGSNALARQIESGAPAELFISADADWIDYVEQKSLVTRGSRRNLLGNDLVLIAPANRGGARLAAGLNLRAVLGDKRIALANPDAVPAGKYAKAAFITLGMWRHIEDRVAGADNVRAALALVARGEAPLGVVYRTDALADKGVRIVDTFPSETHPPIVYPVVTLRRAGPAAQAFSEWLGGPEALATFTKFGFKAP